MNKKPWPEIAEEVEKAISKTTVTVKRSVGGKTLKHDRIMRFSEFSEAVGIDNGQCHRIIKNRMEPTDENRAKIVAWLEKNRQ